jgi:small-conductance mechanosensitive channel
MVFFEIQTGRITFTGFHKDWAQPTFKLSRFLIIVIAVVMVSPYLPGFGSPAFQGLSIFFGILLSLGSTAAIANIVAGTALTYMRPDPPRP